MYMLLEHLFIVFVVPSHLSWTHPRENLPYTNTIHSPPQSAAEHSHPVHEQNRPLSLAGTTRDMLAIDKQSFYVQGENHEDRQIVVVDKF